MGMLRAICDGLCDLLSPPTCAACRAEIAARVLGFCDACGPLIDSASSHGDDQIDACVYAGPLRDAVQRFKYEGESELARALSARLLEPARAFGGRIDCVTAVPLHPRRLRARGYNQAALLARPVARALDVPFRPTLLRRLRDTPAQVGLGRGERRRQLGGAFVAHQVADRAVLVVDDVRTTGATFEAVAEALEAAGARAVFTLALAATPDDGGV